MSNKIEGVPEGYELVRIGTPNIGDHVLDRMGCVFVCELDNYDYKNWPILRKIEKPKKYRPFANAKEFKPHRGRWWKYKDGEVFWPPACYSDEGYGDTDWDYCFVNQTFDDGTPFGIEVSE